MAKEYYSLYPELSAALEKHSLQGKSVLITGGGYGIGADIARSFALRSVSSIILVGRTESKLSTTGLALATAFPNTNFRYFVADISSKADVQRLFESLDQSPHILINNAAYLPEPVDFVDADLNDWWTAFTTNVFGTAIMTQSYLRHRREKAPVKNSALVVTLNTLGAYSVRLPKLSGYSASKAALARWSELVGSDVPETEARFISVHPGAVETDMMFKSGLAGAFPTTESRLVGEFVTWLTTTEAEFLAGRFVWVGWDIEQLLARKDEILGKDLFRTSLII